MEYPFQMKNNGIKIILNNVYFTLTDLVFIEGQAQTAGYKKIPIYYAKNDMIYSNCIL